MISKKNLIYIFLIIFAIGLYYYQSGEVYLTQDNLTDISQQPIYEGTNATTSVYLPSGKISYRLLAKQVRYFDSRRETEFEQPNITIYSNDGIPTWYIEAKTAQLTHEQLLYLDNDIELENLQPNAQLQNITTEHAIIDLITSNVTSDDYVKIVGSSFTSTGIGLFGNLQNKTADILENVKTYYNAPGIMSNTNPVN